jgi:violaxanthin de-epoxidase
MKVVSCLLVTSSTVLLMTPRSTSSFTLLAPTTASRHGAHPSSAMLTTTTTSTLMKKRGGSEDGNESRFSLFHDLKKNVAQVSTGLALCLGIATAGSLGGGSSSTTLPWQPPAAWATSAEDSTRIVKCLFQKCGLQLGECILNPKCLANVVCINTCNGRDDEIDCQIECGNLWENQVVGTFNKCAVSDMSCVPQQKDDGSYPVPSNAQVVDKFDTKLFNGRWYITAGQNKLFDIFPCQVHFFTETEKGQLFAKLNWRVEEPDGEFFTRDALQTFYQDASMPSHLINHDNEYLHYQDDWWIIDYEYDDNESKTPPFAFIYYRGSNDAWDGYGGVVVYTRQAALPKELIPRLRIAANKVGFDFDKDFVLTDNSCPTELSEAQKLVMREQFLGKVALQTENQLQAAATRFRGNAVNSIQAQRLFFDNKADVAAKAYSNLQQDAESFESERVAAAQERSPAASR